MKLSYISLLLQEVIFRISRIKFSGSNVKKFITFSYISGDKNSGKDSYILLKRSFSYISGNETLKKFLIFQETEYCYMSGNGNSKKLLIF